MTHVTIQAVRFVQSLLLFLAISAVALAQPYRIDFRAVNLVENGGAVDIHFNNTTPATIEGLGLDSASAVLSNLQIPATPLNVKIVGAGAGLGSPLIDRDVDVETQMDYVAILHGTSGALGFKVLSRMKSQNPTAGNSLMRIYNAVSFDANSTFDFYLESTDSMAIATGITHDSATGFKNYKGTPHTLFITQAGTKIELARLTVPLVELGRMTLIITGANKENLKVYALSGETSSSYKVPLLQGAEGGILPSVRVFHVWPEKAISGKGRESLDVFFDNETQPRTSNLKYRTASEKFGPLTNDSLTVRFALHNEGLGNPILVQGVPLRRDNDYTAILTKYKSGTAIGMILSTPNIPPLVLEDSVNIRVAQATDYFGTLSVRVVAQITDDTLNYTLPFLGISGFAKLPRGPFKISAYQEGSISPIMTMIDPGNYANSYLTIVLSGDDSTFQMDVLDDMASGKQVFDPSSSVPFDRTSPALSLALQPNPISTTGSISYRLPQGDRVEIALFDPLGRRVATLVDGYRDGGDRSEGVDLSGLPTGAYTWRMRTDGGMLGTGRVVVLR